MINKTTVYPFHHPETGTLTYVINDNSTGKCLIIDAVLDFSVNKIKTTAFDEIIRFIKDKSFHVEWVLDTHLHADHLTAAFLAREQLQCNIGISKEYKNIQEKKGISDNKNEEYYTHYFKDGETFEFGNSTFQVLSVPGHTATCLAYVIEDNIFCGDLLMMPDVGCGRCDFDGGDPYTMYDSVQKIFAFSDEYKIYTCHDYPEADKKFRYLSKVIDQKKNNIFFSSRDKDTFVSSRNKRDSSLKAPRLMNSALGYNLFKSI